MSQNEELQKKQLEVSAKVDTLQETVDATQAKIAALLENNATVVSDLKDQNEALKLQLEDSLTPEQLQAIIDANDAIIAKIDAASADVASTI